MYIKKIKLHNFRRFRDLTIEFKSGRNILVGDNESGKSSILQAIDLTARGGRHRVEDLGLESLFNTSCIREFLGGDKKVENLPDMWVELYLDGISLEELDGKNNSDSVAACGLRMAVEPNFSAGEDIKTILCSDEPTFPFEFYDITFNTFSGASYSGYNKKFKTIFLDNSTIGSEYALNEYISAIYGTTLSPIEQQMIKYQYVGAKEAFKKKFLSSFDSKLEEGYTFSVKNTGKNSLETDLTLEKDGVDIANKGTGIQCFIKTQMALKRVGDGFDAILIEEPENHLSHLNMRKLLTEIEKKKNGQLFIATHSDLISTRLGLRNCILMNSECEEVTRLDFVTPETASFFMKAPDNNMLQFVMAKKVVLVEGDAEFILMDAFCKKILGVTLDDKGIDVIAVDGKCFKRYLELAKHLKMRVAVLTDNDRDYNTHITEPYDGYMNDEFPNIKVFSDNDKERYTFEVAVYDDNSIICDHLFSDGRKTLSVLEYMLANKADVAFRLASEKGKELAVPQYIKNALEWVNT